MTQAANDPVSAGMQGAQQRLERYGLRLSLDAVGPTIQATMDLLQRSQLPVPDRAVEITVELVTIAAMTRVEYDKPELTLHEIDNFLGKLRSFMNSWWHE